MLARLARLVLAVALLAAWQGALLHPLEHHDKQGGLVHVGDEHAPAPRDGTDPSAGLCDALAALAACVFAAPAAFAVFALRHETPAHHSGAPRTAEAPPFRAQGPPPLS